MRIITPLFFSLLLLMAVMPAQAQQPPSTVRVTGVVVDQASIRALPYVTIKNKNAEGDFLTDTTGYFSLMARPGDTLIFQAMSYMPDQYVVPPDTDGGHFAIVEVMQKDAVLLEEVTIRSFPTQQQFEQIFLQIDPDDLPENKMRLKEHVDGIVRDETNMQEYIMDYNKRQRVYWLSREGPRNDFLNPERWTEFIRAWQDGRFTDDAVEKLEGFPAPESENEDGFPSPAPESEIENNQQ